MGLRSRKHLTSGSRRKSKKKLMQQRLRNNGDPMQEIFPQEQVAEKIDVNSEDLPDLYVEKETNYQATTESREHISGRRIIDLLAFLTALKSLKHDGFGCSFFDMDLISEKRIGFKSILIFKCAVCNRKESISTEGDDSKDINRSVVCGAVAIGIGHTQLTELCASLNVPLTSTKTYIKYQNDLHENIQQSFWNQLLLAGAEERRLAIEAGDVDEKGIAFTTVIADGAWSKRSYKTNYNALSGVGCIIGIRTKKILYLGVKNKLCCFCEKYNSKKETVPQHKCYKNWSGPSTAMESAIILDGFKCSMEMHNLKYTCLIGDGDSSVYKKVKENKPYGPNVFVQKIECRNHILRNFCQRIKELCKRPKVKTEVKLFLKANILRFRTAVVGAVKYRKNQNVPLSQKIENLKEDLINGPRHIFGNHDNCVEINSGTKKYFCKGPKPGECDLYSIFKNSCIFNDFRAILMRVVNHSASLLHDVDNNSAENYNSVVNKTVGGKRVNFCKRGSYEARCKAAAIAYNNGGFFIDIVQDDMHGLTGNYTKGHAEKVRNKVCKAPIKKKVRICGEDGDYGAVIEETVADKNDYELAIAKNLFMMNFCKIDREKILKDTIGQNINPAWHKERANRITASNFGTVCKMRPNTNTANLVKIMLNEVPHVNSKSMQYGTLKESEGKDMFSNVTNLEITECGIFIDKDYPFLGASPDGIIDADTIIEIKCPYSARNHKILQAIDDKLITYLEKRNTEKGNTEIKLKNNHNYMYQVQGQLHISRKNSCYFVVYTGVDIFIEKISYSHRFWEENIRSKLIQFYLFALLPEIVDSRHSRNMTVREIKCKDL